MTQLTPVFGRHPYIPQALTRPVELEEGFVPSSLKTGVITIGLIMTVFLLWSAYAPVDEVAVAEGQIVPSGYIQTIQHLEGGIVRKIDVEDGQMVEAGQVLMKLDAVQANGDLAQMHARQNSLQMQALRLRNFVSRGGGAAISPNALTNEERAILSSMVESRAGQQNVLRDQLSQKQKEVQALSVTLDALRKNITLMEKENAMQQKMAAEGYGSQLMALTSERELNQLRGQMQETAAQKIRAQDGVREAQNRLQSLDADLNSDAMKTLGQVESELAEVNKSLAKLQDAAERTTVMAPVRGIVKGLAVHTLGAVVEPGKTLMEIVPVGKELLVEAMVQPKDVGHLQKGQPVKVKVSAFDSSRYGNLSGSLQEISASTFKTEKDQNYYKVKIKLDKNYVGRDAQRNTILPGMTVQANIVTGEKTVMDYLLKPLHTTFSDSFHEI